MICSLCGQESVIWIGDFQETECQACGGKNCQREHDTCPGCGRTVEAEGLCDDCHLQARDL